MYTSGNIPMDINKSRFANHNTHYEQLFQSVVYCMKLCKSCQFKIKNNSKTISIFLPFETADLS